MKPSIEFLGLLLNYWTHRLFYILLPALSTSWRLYRKSLSNLWPQTLKWKWEPFDAWRWASVWIWFRRRGCSVSFLWMCVFVWTTSHSLPSHSLPHYVENSLSPSLAVTIDRLKDSGHSLDCGCPLSVGRKYGGRKLLLATSHWVSRAAGNSGFLCPVAANRRAPLRKLG